MEFHSLTETFSFYWNRYEKVLHGHLVEAQDRQNSGEHAVLRDRFLRRLAQDVLASTRISCSRLAGYLEVIIG